MKNPTPYLKMRVLGAIDMAEGNSIQARIQAVSQMTFTDEEGHRRQFTWRTIQTWYSRYQKHGVTGMENKSRADKGKTRKVKPEGVQEAIATVLPKVRGCVPKLSVLYRALYRARRSNPLASGSHHLLPDGQRIRTAQARSPSLQQNPPGLRESPCQ